MARVAVQTQVGQPKDYTVDPITPLSSNPDSQIAAVTVIS